MAKKKEKRGSARCPRKRVSVLDRLKPEEAQAVLQRLLAAHRGLRAETRQIAKSLLSEVSFKSVADEVEQAVRALDLDDLGSRAGEHSWGYTSPTEAAWELLEESVEPFIEDMKRQFALGLDAEALEICKGLALGLYRVCDERGDEFLEWASDFPAETAAYALGIWRAGGDRNRPKRGRRKQRVFDWDFVEEFVPEWEDLIDRA